MRIITLSLAVLALSGAAIAFQQPTADKAAPQAPSAQDAQVIAKQLPSYPLDVCPVSKEKLGGMGEGVNLVQDGRLVRFCCKDCVASFQKDPAKVMGQVDQAMIDAQKKSYPLTSCPISSKPIEGAGVDYLYGTRLVRFCCPKCPDAFLKDPTKTLAQLDAAAKNPKQAPAPAGGAKKTGG